ncbi:transposase [Treponema endosymbiont of Eucomonympha sp.]|uniref:transposase n=1 Tax=Treponema endosymbiont of Eucomonympha sp. TaxID=1580831 RepID=UPI001EE6EA93|nr:transposase [Treponema endosymbiont of Eucomonympha sp.]
MSSFSAVYRKPVCADSSSIIAWLRFGRRFSPASKEADITAVIPPVKSRKEQRAYSHELYRARHVIENVFRALKRRRGIATRYTKLTASFIAAIHVRCLFLYLPVHTT